MGMLPAQAQSPAPLTLNPAQVEALQNALRDLKNQMSDAVARRDVDKMFSMVTDDIAFTAMDNVPLHGVKAARAYYDKMMRGAESIVTDMNITFEPDVLSILYDNGQTAVSTGDSVASFKLRAGLEFSAPLRWTATLVQSNGKWKIASAHFSANMFENPIEGAVSKYIWPELGFALVVGLLLGFFVGRKKRRAVRSGY